MAELFAVDIESVISEEIYKDLLDAVCEKRKERIKRYHFEKDAKRSLYGSTLVRYLACSKMNMNNKDICMVNNQYGKPYFDGISNQFFNVSHSGKWVICGWSQSEIGVDVEVVKDIELDIAKRFFSESEYLSLLDAKDKKKLFYDLWTLKESYIKYKGCGLSMPLNSFSFDIKNDTINLISKEIEKPLFYKYDIDESHKIAVCTKDTKIKEITYVLPEMIWKKLC